MPPCRQDYHLHTKLCGHAQGEISEYVDAALAAGLTEIGFAEHLPIAIPLEKKLYLDKHETPLFVDAIHRSQDQYAGRITILLGGECDYAPGQESEIEDVLDRWPFDYVLGSIHFIDGWSHDTTEYQSEWTRRDAVDVYCRYFDLIARAAASGYFDGLAHIDLIKKFGHRAAGPAVIAAEIAAADAVARARMTVEINTSGFDVPAAEQYPSERILRLLIERDIPICFGSDSHNPIHVARHFDKARALARSVGFTHVTTFRSRKPTPCPF